MVELPIQRIIFYTIIESLWQWYLQVLIHTLLAGHFLSLGTSVPFLCLCLYCTSIGAGTCSQWFLLYFQALGCLVRLASVRRSLFTDDAARSRFLAHLMSGTKEILQTGQGSFDHLFYLLSQFLLFLSSRECTSHLSVCFLSSESDRPNLLDLQRTIFWLIDSLWDDNHILALLI